MMLLIKMQEALELNPEDPVLHYELGNLYQRNGELDEAVEEYQKALSIQPALTQALNNSAIVYAIKREYDKSLPLFVRITDIDPDRPGAYYNIACIYARQNKAEESIEWLKKAIKRGYENWDLIKTDNDLDNIRSSSYYKEIIRDQGHKR
jgi:tetratricopeptide (TPR) repeat protein